MAEAPHTSPARQAGWGSPPARADIAAAAITYPIRLDPGDQVRKQYRVDGIPMSFVYDRSGRMVGTAMDMGTRGQFLV